MLRFIKSLFRKDVPKPMLGELFLNGCTRINDVEGWRWNVMEVVEVLDPIKQDSWVYDWMVSARDLRSGFVHSCQMCGKMWNSPDYGTPINTTKDSK